MASAWALYAFANGDQIRVGMDVEWDTPDVLAQLRRETVAMLGEAMAAAYEVMERVPEDDE